jgi:colanic acid biosynthesis glycosyl transferase WcaI
LRVTILTNYFPPEGGSGSRLVGSFARYLVEQGDSVEVHCPYPSYHPSRSDVPGGVRICRRGAPLPAILPHRLRRGLEHLVRPLLLASAGGQRPDVVYVWLPPPALLPAAALVGRRLNCPVVMHVQDLFPFNAQDTGVLRSSTLADTLERMVRPFYRTAREVVVHAPSAASYFAGLGVPCRHLHNWVDVPPGPPDPPKLSVPFHVVFAGVMGLAQGLHSILEAATQLRDDRRFQFTLAGDGARRNEIEETVAQRQLTNVTLQPMLQSDAYLRLVADADLFLVSLAPMVRYPVIPSKIGDAMAAGRPILAALPEGDAAELILSSGAGVVVPPAYGTKLADAIVTLAQDSSRCRAMGLAGHAYARIHLNTEVVLPKLRNVLADATTQQ